MLSLAMVATLLRRAHDNAAQIATLFQNAFTNTTIASTMHIDPREALKDNNPSTTQHNGSAKRHYSEQAKTLTRSTKTLSYLATKQIYVNKGTHVRRNPPPPGLRPLQ